MNSNEVRMRFRRKPKDPKGETVRSTRVNLKIPALGQTRRNYFGLRCGIYERMEQAEKDTLSGEGEESRQNYELALSNNEHELEVYIKNTFRVIGESRRRQGKRMDATSYRVGREKGATLQINQAIKA